MTDDTETPDPAEQAEAQKPQGLEDSYETWADFENTHETWDDAESAHMIYRGGE